MQKRMSFSVVLLSIVLFSLQTKGVETLPTLTIHRGIHEDTPFLAHVGAGPFDSYLAKNLVFAPIQALKGEIERHFRNQLVDRGEAHITVITPPEFQKLKSKISIEEINALSAKIAQDADFTPLCLGHGELKIGSKLEEAYFIVVRSEALRQVRHTIARRFVEQGGRELDFAPDFFFPHITVGFTKRDLHAEDGIFKDVRSCIANLEYAE